MNNPDGAPLDADLRVLIVDDIPPARRVVKSLLRRLGVTAVVEAGGVGEADKLLKTDTVDVVITDINLKDGSGLDLLRTIRADSKLSGLAVVVMTSDAQREEVIEGGMLGVAGFLLKPFDANRLRDKIAAALA